MENTYFTIGIVIFIILAIIFYFKNKSSSAHFTKYKQKVNDLNNKVYNYLKSKGLPIDK
jgi:uncharacterized membrane protein YciS (DUF1049 family)